ncbi:DNA polymerase III subunit gamma/tau [Flavobacterium columnare]|uniref:DNA polymerase III subunit gamma/tau n=1 Tax=Flavobacterium columnare TaxID=996 RepID=UPI003C2ABE7F
MEQFIVSARKYRPQTFKDVVGQQAITNTLLNAIDNNHLAQALLFTGPRGVGKTTCARILARKINQEGYDDPNEDFAFNVFELDAASNNSVDDIRNLIDQVRIPPQTGKYKVYIIDEVHMLSTAAFNAFLKTLEEPPRHAIFILATTEKHKIIPTILSRCQIFDFKRITVKDAKEHLAEVAKSQDIVFEDDALHIIAQKADGAMRDALSIFDRVVSYCGKNLTRTAVTENLNVLDFEYYIKVTDLILENKIPDLLLAYNEILAKGFDSHHFVAGLASHFRNLLVCKNPATLVLLEAGEHAQKLYGEQAQKASQDFLLQGIELANDCDLKYKVSQNQRLLVELCLMQLASITFDGEKKANSFIIPPTYYRNSSFSITELKPVITAQGSDSTNTGNNLENEQKKSPSPQLEAESKLAPNQNTGPKVSSLSLSSIKVKKDLEAQLKPEQKHHDELPVEPFTETEMLEQWLKYAQKLGNKGYKILEALMLINDPVLEGTTIIHELPNESSKIDFEGEKHDLLGYLRGKLHNHTINLEVKLNETIESKKAFTAEEKYQLMRDINPALDTLRKLFDLDV